jgi:hypothetical protein
MPTVTVTIDSHDWMCWVWTKYNQYIDHCIDYNENRRPSKYYCTMRILNFDAFCDANTNTLQRKYQQYLEEL